MPAVHAAIFIPEFGLFKTVQFAETSWILWLESWSEFITITTCPTTLFNVAARAKARSMPSGRYAEMTADNSLCTVVIRFAMNSGSYEFTVYSTFLDT